MAASFHSRTRALLRLGLSVAFVWVVVTRNVFSFGEFVMGSTLVARFSDLGLFSDARFYAWRAALNGLLRYPLGGRQADIGLNYAHNLWLDVGYVAGIIPFLLLVIFSWLLARSLGYLLRDRQTPDALKNFLIGIYVSVHLAFFVEPVLEGAFVSFSMFCFITGVTM